MKSALDSNPFHEWFTESANIGFHEFNLVARTGNQIGGCVQKVQVHVESCAFLQVLNEFATKKDDEDRKGHVVHEHKNSKLLEWVANYSLIFETEIERAEAKHFSILLSDNIYHFVTLIPPIVTPLKNVRKK